MQNWPEDQNDLKLVQEAQSYVHPSNMMIYNYDYYYN